MDGDYVNQAPFEPWPGEDADNPDNDPRDFNGRGTHCAGIAGAITKTAGDLVLDAADFGEDLTVAARGAVAGAIVAAADLAVTVEEAAAAAANGAIDAAASVSSNAAGRVRDTEVGVIDGVKVVVDAAVE